MFFSVGEIHMLVTLISGSLIFVLHPCGIVSLSRLTELDQTWKHPAVEVPHFQGEAQVRSWFIIPRNTIVTIWLFNIAMENHHLQ
jgi:hypothetical protein